MAIHKYTKLEESLKNFLIVGETLDGIHKYIEYQLINLLMVFILVSTGLFSLKQAIIHGSFWYLLSVCLIIGSIYFLINFRVTITYAITKFRIMRVVEGNFLSRLIFRSSRLIGFTDLHYEHVESINIGSQPLNILRLYASIFIISIGWLYFDNPGSIIALESNLDNLFVLLFFIVGIINIILSIPLGGVRLIIQSISGDSMQFPEKHTPAEFIDDLIFNCRTFLSYGAI